MIKNNKKNAVFNILLQRLPGGNLYNEIKKYKHLKKRFPEITWFGDVECALRKKYLLGGCGF